VERVVMTVIISTEPEQEMTMFNELG